MRSMMGIWTASLLAALCASALTWVASLLHERGMNPLRRLMTARPMSAPFQTALLAIAAIGFVQHGATKSTNGVPDRAGGHAPISLRDTPSILDGGQGFAATTNTDWLAFGAYEDWMYVQDGGWCFRFGSNLVDRVMVLSCGDVYASPISASNRISVLGIPFSIVPAANWHMLSDGRESLFWHSVTPSNSLLLTWRNALLLRDTNMPVTVQAELFPDGAARLRYNLSGLGDYAIMAEPGVTNRLLLLIGERYRISSEAAFSHIAFGCSDAQTPESHPVATNIADRIVEVEWPVSFSAETVMVT